MDEQHAATARYSEGMRRLARGDETGWELCEARLDALDGKSPRPPGPLWSGEPLEGRTVMVWPEQGWGDMIMMSRYVPLIETLGGKAVAVCQPALMRLFEAMDLRVENRAGAFEIPAHALFCPYMSLPLRLGMFSPPTPILPTVTLKASRGRIGIRTSGSPTHPCDRHRSLDGATAELLRELPGVVDLDPELTGARDFYETAEIISGLDLVISVDTSVAHLSGVMGKPTHILLPHRGLDWRWGLSGDRTAWYPSARLWRQSPGEGWAAVVDRMLRVLGGVAVGCRDGGSALIA